MAIDEILPQLLVGCCPQDRVDIDLLKASHGITAVLSLQTDDDFVSWGIDWQDLEGDAYDPWPSSSFERHRTHNAA
jgi:hypothetical protein